MTTATQPQILCFGEILWDCLSRGLFLGGAPCNVAYHLKQLGCRPIPVTALGNDFLGEEITRRLGIWEIDTRFVGKVDDKMTGAVRVDLNAHDSPIYRILEDVAWDAIPDSSALREAAQAADALVFGTLALRGEHNRALLADLLPCVHSLKVLDVNLRPPFIDTDYLWTLTPRADLVKLNDEELSFLTGASLSEPLEKMVSLFADESGCQQICVTGGARGAGLWQEGAWQWVDAAPVTVRDTVGAGDAFLAALLTGLLDGQETPEEMLRRACRLAGFVAGCDGATPDYDGVAYLPGNR